MLYRKGSGMEARLCFIGHGLMENRSGLLVAARLTCVSGHAERLAALEMIEPHADRPRDLGKVDWSFTFAAAAHNLIRLPKLLGATA